MFVHMKSVKPISERQSRPKKIRAKKPSPNSINEDEEMSDHDVYDFVIINSVENESDESDRLASPHNDARDG